MLFSGLDHIPPIAMHRPEFSAQSIAGKDRQLSTLMRAAQAFQALDQHIQPILSDRARGRVRVACVDQDQLVLAAQSPTWASLARLEAEACLEAARAVWPREIKSVKVVVVHSAE